MSSSQYRTSGHCPWPDFTGRASKNCQANPLRNQIRGNLARLNIVLCWGKCPLPGCVMTPQATTHPGECLIRIGKHFMIISCWMTTTDAMAHRTQIQTSHSLSATGQHQQTWEGICQKRHQCGPWMMPKLIARIGLHG